MDSIKMSNISKALIIFSFPATGASAAVKERIGGETGLKRDIAATNQGKCFCFGFSSKYKNQDFDFKRGTNYPIIKGRFKTNIQFWPEELSAYASIINIIEQV